MNVIGSLLIEICKAKHWVKSENQPLSTNSKAYMFWLFKRDEQGNGLNYLSPLFIYGELQPVEYKHL